jgi:RNA polymerase sigma-70 factor (ECF subfamily)
MELPASERAIHDMTTSHPAGDTDAAAISRSVADPPAFGPVFDRHFQAVYAYGQRRVGLELAEEVAAETFLRAFEGRGRYDVAHPDALPWLLGIAGNVMRRHWRSERRRLAAYARAAVCERPGGPPEVAGEVFAAVARLPRRQREVLLLWAWADLSYAEIAIALGLPIGTVRSRLARARSRLGDAPSPSLAPFDDAKEASHA